ncbi:carboxymuconolactone decarboxylase family protein [Rhodococcus pyridinivorans]
MAHVNLGKQHPAAYKSVLALNEEVEEAVARAGLDAKLAELVKVRTSQLTECAFCLRMHTRDALDKGETTDRLAVLAAWWESQYFTEHERAALAEDVTHHMEPAGHEWDNGSLSDEQVSAITWLTIVMNAWNRIAVRSHYPVAP